MRRCACFARQCAHYYQRVYSSFKPSAPLSQSDSKRVLPLKEFPVNSSPASLAVPKKPTATEHHLWRGRTLPKE
jgi:hypothetical protein